MKKMRRNKKIIERKEKEKHGWKVKKDKNFQNTVLLSQMYEFNQILIFYLDLQNFKSTETNTHVNHGKGKKFSTKITVNISKAHCAIIGNSKQVLEFLLSLKA